MDQPITTNDAVFAKVAELICINADVSSEAITPESKFQDLGLDSLDAIALIGDLEQEYGISIPSQEVLRIKTVGQAVESLIKQIQ